MGTQIQRAGRVALGSVLTKCSPWASPPQLRPWARTSKEPSSARERPPPRGLFLLPTAASARLLLAVGFDSRRRRPIFPAMSSLSSRTRSAPAGFIEPCLPSPADKPPSGANWIHEIKHDGYRLMARRDPVGIRLLTRRGNDWADRYPLIVEAVNHLKVRSCLIDGEVVCCDERGLAIFATLRQRRNEATRLPLRLRSAGAGRHRHAARTNRGSQGDAG